jgi:hypothetical protein
MAEPLALDDLLYLVVVSVTFDPDDYELRWPPQLFTDEMNRLVRSTGGSAGGRLFDNPDDPAEVEWLLTEAFSSTVPAEEFHEVASSHWREPTPGDWITDLVREAANWPEPGTRKPFWSTRMLRRDSRPRLNVRAFTRSFIQLIEELESDGYFVHAFGQYCVDQNSRRDASAVLTRRLGHPVSWPLRFDDEGRYPLLDYLCDFVEVLHDVVARPSRRSYHEFNQCGWHYSDFATRPGRRLYRWHVNRLLADSDLGLRMAEEGEDLGRLVRVEPSGLEDLPERALKAATPATVDRVQHAIALFRSRNASVEDRRSAIIVLAGILEERRDMLKAELLTKDETALFQIANQFAVRHQRADQRGDYDPAFLEWLFWWYLDTVQLTHQLLARQASGRSRR